TLAFTGVLLPLIDSVAVTTYTVNATDNPNQISLTNSPGAGNQCLRVSIDPATFRPADFANKANVVINGLGGNDTILVDYTRVSAGLSTVTVHGNAGDDTINVRNTPGPVVTNVLGDEGNDTVTVGSTAPAMGGVLSGIRGLVRVDGGPGTDVLTADNAGDV